MRHTSQVDPLTVEKRRRARNENVCQGQVSLLHIPYFFYLTMLWLLENALSVWPNTTVLLLKHLMLSENRNLRA